MKRKLNEQDVPEVVPHEQPEASKNASHGTSTFATLGLDSRLLQAVQREKFNAPTLVQSKTIPLALSGKSVLVRAKTGSGKTYAYILPVLHHFLRRRTATASQRSKAKRTEVLILVPTKELAAQVFGALKAATTFCSSDVGVENLSRKEDDAVTRAKLAEGPAVVVATPSRAALWIENGMLSVENMRSLIIDEADLVLSYGYEDDLRSLADAMPIGVQTLMMSATLRTELDTLTELFCKDSKPEILDLSKEEAAEKPTLAHYIVRTAEEDKFLLIYAILKLQLIKGKIIVFVADVDRAYRVKLFLEQFGIRSCVLNSELPVNSRLHVVEEFNRGVYEIIIAADEADVVGNELQGKAKALTDANVENDATEEAPAVPDAQSDGNKDSASDDNAEVAPQPRKKKSKFPRKNRKEDPEYGVSRGIDFRAVTCVLNFDLPTTTKSYTHRVGRTARAGKTGMALSFYVPRELYRKHKSTSIPQCEKDETVLRRIRQRFDDAQPTSEPSASNPSTDLATISPSKTSNNLQEWAVDWSKLEGLRYRFTDALRSVTRLAVREARTRELRNELINSEKLKRHFEENPDDLRHLRHDREVRVGRQMPHLKHVPEYLLSNGTKEGLGKDVGFVGLRKVKDNRIRKAREFSRGRGKGKLAKGKGMDPLKTLNARGRAKKA